MTGERVAVSQTHDYRHFYRGLHGSPSVCRIRVYRGSGDATLVIASELPDNPGTSITNVAEMLATEMEWRHCPDPGDRMIWIEHYPVREALRGMRADEHFALVTFLRGDDGQLHSPRWQHIASDTLSTLLGQLVDAERS